METFTFPPQSNRADWSFSYEATDDGGNEINLSAIAGVSISLQIHATSSLPPDIPAFDGTSADGAIAIDGNTFTAMVRAAELASLKPGSYRVSVIMTDGTNTAQLINGILPLVEGYNT